jgi:hypothetical protein
MVVLASLILLVVSCGMPSPETAQSEQAARDMPTITAEGSTPTKSPAPATAEPAATTTPSPAQENPTPTHTLSPTAEEPTPTRTPPPTATPTASPPTPSPTATAQAILTGQDVQRITPADAKTLLDGGEADLYDVRSAAEYNTRHAAGARSFPDTDTAAGYGQLPTDKSLIFY